MSLYGESGYEICHSLAGTLIFKFLTIPDWLKFKTHGCKLLENIVFASGYVGGFLCCIFGLYFVENTCTDYKKTIRLLCRGMFHHRFPSEHRK